MFFRGFSSSSSSRCSCRSTVLRMTSITTSRREGRSHKNISNDDNTSDESLLLMVDNIEEKAPLLNMMDDEIDRSPTMPMDDIPLRSRSLKSHCPTAEEPFDYKARNRLIVVLILCLIFMIIEIVGRYTRRLFSLLENPTIVSLDSGGVLSNSTAVITDAAHMCIDATGFLISLAAMYLATKAPTDKLSFGYIRAGLHLPSVSPRRKSTFSSFRSPRSVVECLNDLVSHGNSRLHGHRPLYSSRIRSETHRNDCCCLVRRYFQYCVGMTPLRLNIEKATAICLFLLIQHVLRLTCQRVWTRTTSSWTFTWSW